MRRLSTLLLSLSLLTSASVFARPVVDNLGRTVDVPETVKTVAVTNVFPMAAAVTAFTGSGDTVVAMAPSSMKAAKTGSLGKLFPAVLKADTTFMAGGNVNVESLAALKPDVVLVNAKDRRQIDALTQAGLCAFAVSPTQYGFDVMKTYNHWVQDLAALFPEHAQKAQALQTEAKRLNALVDDRLALVPPTKRPKALVLFQVNPQTIIVSGKKFFGHYWLTSVGATNVAESILAPANTAKVTLEDIYAMNPDVIFVTNFTPQTPQDFFTNHVPQGDWSGLKAVKTKRVYKMPLGIYRTFTPSADAPLTRLWMAKTLYPDTFKDVDMTVETRRYYEALYGATLSDDDATALFPH